MTAERNQVENVFKKKLNRRNVLSQFVQKRKKSSIGRQSIERCAVGKAHLGQSPRQCDLTLCLQKSKVGN